MGYCTGLAQPMVGCLDWIQAIGSACEGDVHGQIRSRLAPDHDLGNWTRLDQDRRVNRSTQFDRLDPLIGSVWTKKN